MVPAQRLTWLVLSLAMAAACASAAPFLMKGGSGPLRHTSIRGVEVLVHGAGPYRHMPADVAVQGFAQDAVTFLVGVPFVLGTLIWARRGTRAGHLALTGAVAYLFVQYFLYLAMATYNELFLLWVLLVLLSSQAMLRLVMAVPPANFVAPQTSRAKRRYVGAVLVVNACLISLLWLASVLPPLLDGSLYPAGLAHFTTMIVQGFDLALFLPPSLIAGWAYLKSKPHGELLAPIYAVFLSLQMLALLAKVVWMQAIGSNVGPALVIIPSLLVAATVAAVVALQPHHRTI